MDLLMKITIIDGQGGRIGKSIIEQIKKKQNELELYAIGTNSIATSAMLKAGADYGATGDNAVIVNAADSDIIVGPIGIVFANALLGEITPRHRCCNRREQSIQDSNSGQPLQSFRSRLHGSFHGRVYPDCSGEDRIDAVLSSCSSVYSVHFSSINKHKDYAC